MSRLIDADALIAETMKNRCDDCDRRKGVKRGKITFVYDFGEAPCRACDVGDMIDILDEAPTVGGWISVKDRMPDRKWTDYLVATRLCDGTMGVNIAWLESDEGEWASNDEWIRRGREVITHWMPLPEKPEE